jgi:IclR family transcriptional regulator, positive regulator for flagellar biogenesis
MSARPRQKDTTAPVTQTLERGLEVLRAFHNDAKPLANRTLVERTGLPKATVSRITSTLVSLGYLTRIASTGRYQLGTGMLSIGNAFLAGSNTRRIALPMMEELAAQHDVSIGLAVPDRLNMIYTIWCRSPKTLTLRLTAGSILPMSRTAVGRAYLWALPPALRRGRLAQIKEQEGAKGGSIIDSIYAAFDDLDRHGFCVRTAEFQKNTFGVAVPLIFGAGSTIMSLGCGAATLDVKEATLRRVIAPDLIRTAAQLQTVISQTLDVNE